MDMNFEGPKNPKIPEFGSPRAMKITETPQEYNASNPEHAAALKQKHQEKIQQAENKKKEQQPTPEQIKAQQEREEASKMIGDHFSGNSRIPEGILTPDEEQALGQMETLYREQKAANPDQPVKFGLDDKSNEIYARLLHRLPLAIQEHSHTQKYQTRADEIRENLGLEKQHKQEVKRNQEQEKTPDLANMSQDQYAEWLVDNLRDEKDIYHQLTLRPEYRQYTKTQRIEMIQNEPTSQELKDLAAGMNQLWAQINASPIEGIKAIGDSGKARWNNFKINEGTASDSRAKGYLTLKNPGKDFSPQVFQSFMKTLQEAGFSGQIKTYEIGSKYRFQFDNIVFHGKTKSDVERAMNLAQQFFGEKLSQTQFGRDGKDSAGEERSHTDLLAEKVKILREQKYGQI